MTNARNTKKKGPPAHRKNSDFQLMSQAIPLYPRRRRPLLSLSPRRVPPSSLASASLCSVGWVDVVLFFFVFCRCVVYLLLLQRCHPNDEKNEKATTFETSLESFSSDRRLPVHSPHSHHTAPHTTIAEGSAGLISCYGHSVN